MSVWRWDKKEAILRFPVKEMYSCVKVSSGGTVCIGGARQSGRLSLWEMQTGQLLGEVENAHYMDVADIDITSGCDMVLTGGKDFKVKLWVLTDLYFGGRQ
jgi:WD40 repeat protein